MLKTSEFPRVRHLVEKTSYPQYPLGVVDGPVVGSVYADAPLNPAVALVWEKNGDVYLSGEPTPEAVAGVTAVLNNEIIPSGERQRRYMFYVDYHPRSWEGHLPAMLSPRRPIRDKRLLYSTHVPGPGVPDMLARLTDLSRVPEGCTLREVDSNILSCDSLGHISRLRAEIQKQWPSLECFYAMGVGYCLVRGGDIASWCLTEYPTKGACSIGVETVEEYWRKGYGTVVSAACLRKCLEEGNKPYWDLWASNSGSRALAERLGLTFVREYPVFFLWYNEVDNLLVNARVAARDGSLADSIEYFKMALAAALHSPELSLSMLFGTPSDRAAQYKSAARVAEAAGRPDMATAYLAMAREEASGQ